jgi:phospholipid/cholesterol/gamma-HCH transport system substrate-binding protein
VPAALSKTNQKSNGATMDDRIMQFRVGVVVLAVSLIAGIMTLRFGHFAPKSYTIYIDFTSAPGIAAGTPIKSSGVLIGRVTDVVLDESKPAEPVHVTAEIESKYKILSNQTVQLSSGLLGDAEIDIVDVAPSPPPAPPAAAPAPPVQLAPPVQATPPDQLMAPDQPAPPPAPVPAVPPTAPKQNPTPIQPGTTLHGNVGANPVQDLGKLEADLGMVSKSLSGASEEVRELAHNINGMLGNGDPNRLKRLVDKTEASMDSMQRTLNDVDKIVGDPKMQANMRKSLDDLPETLHQMQESFHAIQKTTALADENLKNLEGVTRPLSEQGEQMVHHAHQSIRELDELLAQMSQFSRGLNSSQGTLGQLMNSPELYQQLTEAASNINDLTHRLQPILNDVRDFTDKIARHPEVLGVRGAIDRSPGIK